MCGHLPLHLAMVEQYSVIAREASAEGAMARLVPRGALSLEGLPQALENDTRLVV